MIYRSQVDPNVPALSSAKLMVSTVHPSSTTFTQNALRTTTCQKASSKIRAAESVVAGMIAGCITRTSTSPLDVVKILFQLQRKTSKKITIPTTTTTTTTLSSSIATKSTTTGTGATTFMSSKTYFHPSSSNRSSSSNSSSLIRKPSTTTTTMTSTPFRSTVVSSSIRTTPTPTPTPLMMMTTTTAITPPTMTFLNRNPFIRGESRLHFVNPLTTLKPINALTPSTNEGYRGLTHAFQKIYSQEGVQGLWKGNLAGCCRLAPYAGSKFFVYDTCKRLFGDENGNLNNVQRLTYGSASGVVATLISYPLELVRTTIIMQNPQQKNIHGIADGLRKIYLRKGIPGLYQGGVTGIVGVIPFEGVQFACYEILKDYSLEHRYPKWRWPQDKTALSSLDFLVIGSVSGAVAQTIAYPLDVIKKRLQAQIFSSTQGETVYKGMVHCFQTIVKEEGVSGLYKGTLPNLIRIAPYAAVMFTSYESVKKFLRWISGEIEELVAIP